MTTHPKLWAVLRISLGWIFFWAFLDKVFGLGFATASGSAWLDGVSPTKGFLKFGTSGPFANLFQAMAESVFVEWLYMLGLALIGLSLLLGIATRIASWSGAVLMLLFWLATLWPEHNPFLDEHIIYIILLLTFPLAQAGNTWGLGKRWNQSRLIQSWKFLR